MKLRSPESFSIEFQTNYKKSFEAKCLRERAPLHADRIFNLARFGYYSDNYFFRVLPNFVAQFGTGGDPIVSNVYNYSTTYNAECAILKPQPPYMPYCLASALKQHIKNSTGKLAWTSRQSRRSFLPLVSGRVGIEKSNCTTALSNTLGTMAMSTSYNIDINDFSDGVTWNATAELFINLADNSKLDKYLFIPICTIENMNLVSKFPSFGEVADLGGPGPGLGQLYERGNVYIEDNQQWASMAKVERVIVCDTSRSN
jgi:cyclophilin family peptidyl-prolyl cis-trans isomerase